VCVPASVLARPGFATRDARLSLVLVKQNLKYSSLGPPCGLEYG
jgi:hypothetical protein